jgi:hypothetical protein
MGGELEHYPCFSQGLGPEVKLAAHMLLDLGGLDHPDSKPSLAVAADWAATLLRDRRAAGIYGAVGNKAAALLDNLTDEIKECAKRQGEFACPQHCARLRLAAQIPRPREPST